MKYKIIISVLLMSSLFMQAFRSPENSFTSSRTHIRFFSSTPAEDIEANNYKAISTLNPQSGNVVFSVPMQSFEFEKALMQKHFNQPNFLDTKSYPKAKLTGVITDMEPANYAIEGTYPVKISGQLEIRGKSNQISEKGTIEITKTAVIAKSTFNLTLADYGIEFKKGKPSSNIAKTIEVSVLAEYTKN